MQHPALLPKCCNVNHLSLLTGRELHPEAAGPHQDQRQHQAQPGAGDPGLQAGGPEAVQAHLPAGEGEGEVRH